MPEATDAGLVVLSDGQNERRWRLVPAADRPAWRWALETEPPFARAVPLLQVEERTWHRGGFKSVSGFSGTSEYGRNTDARHPFRVSPLHADRTVELPGATEPVTKIVDAKNYVWAASGTRLYRIAKNGQTVTLSNVFDQSIVDIEPWGEDLYVTIDEGEGKLYRLSQVGNPDVWESETPPMTFLDAGGFAMSWPQVVASSTTEFGPGTSQAQLSFTVPDVPDRLLVVVVSFTVSTVSSVTYGGAELVPLPMATWSILRNQYWYLVAPPVGEGTVTVTWSTTTDNPIVTVLCLRDVDPERPLELHAQNVGSSAAPSVTVPGGEVGALVVDTAVQLSTATLSTDPWQQVWGSRSGTTLSSATATAFWKEGARSTFSWTSTVDALWIAEAAVVHPSQPANGNAIRVRVEKQLGAGRFVLVRVNWQSSDGDDDVVGGVADAKGNTWTKLGSWAAPGFVSSALFMSYLRQPLDEGDTIEASFTEDVWFRSIAYSEWTGPAVTFERKRSFVAYGTASPSLFLGILPYATYVFIATASTRAPGDVTLTQPEGYQGDVPLQGPHYGFDDYRHVSHIGVVTTGVQGILYQPTLSAPADTILGAVALRTNSRSYLLASGPDRLFKVSKTGLLRNIVAGLDPLVDEHWADAVQVGSPTSPPRSLVAYGHTALVGKDDGVYAVDDLGRARPVLRRMTKAPDNTKGMTVVEPWVYVPHSGGLFRFTFGAVEAVGIERELASERELAADTKWEARPRALASFEQWLFAAVTDGVGQSDVLVAREAEGPESPFGPLVWDSFWRLDTPGTGPSVVVHDLAVAVDSAGEVTLWAGGGSSFGPAYLGRLVLRSPVPQTYRTGETFRRTPFYDFEYQGPKQLLKATVAVRNLYSPVGTNALLLRFYDDPSHDRVYDTDRSGQLLQVVPTASGPVRKSFLLPDHVRADRFQAEVVFDLVDGSYSRPDLTYLALYAIPLVDRLPVVSCLVLVSAEGTPQLAPDRHVPQRDLVLLRSWVEQGTVLTVRGPWLERKLATEAPARALLRDVRVVGQLEGPSRTELVVELELLMVEV